MTKEQFYESLEESVRPIPRYGYEIDFPKGIYDYANKLFNMSVRTDEYIYIYPLTPEGENQFEEDRKHNPYHEIHNFMYKKQLYNLLIILYD
tara:strand:- start:43 stop:318 length:276 start_codon:yes stop_codon:yes gene_type:complete